MPYTRDEISLGFSERIPNTSTLSMLMALQSALHVMCDETGLSTMVISALQRVPGIATAYLRFNNSSSVLPKESWVHIAVETQQKRYGWIELELNHPEAYRVYDPFIRNISNTIALTLENRRQQHQLNETLGHLEEIISLRTAELKNTNIQLQEEITERKLIEHEREQLLKKLQRAVSVRDDFISIASHELRTPVTNIFLQLQSLTDGLRKYVDEQVYMQISLKAESALKQAQRLNHLIDHLLDSSHVSGELILSYFDSFDFGALVHEVIERFRLEAIKANCIVRDHIEAAVMGWWDRLRIDQVITNLLTNAIKYGAGSPIDIKVERQGTLAKLMVRDYGIGIAPQDHKRIFERFERAVSRYHYGGFGLGLFIAQKIVEGHGGAIKVESELGNGATFIVELPLLGQKSA